jgi:GT2 family glycosyltransferase
MLINPHSKDGVTVIIPTLDREAFLKNTIEDLLAQTVMPLEILVVDQSTHVSSGFLDFVRDNADVISYHRVSFRGSAKARNYGWQRARYDAIVFVDDDIRCDPGFLAQHERALSLAGVGLVAGAVDVPGQPRKPAKSTGRFFKWTGTATTGFEAGGEFDCDHVIECNFAISRHAMAAVGGIDEAFNERPALYEGIDLGLRVKNAGMRVHFNGRARVTHLAAPSGGNRERNIPLYFWGLARNQAILIHRHLRWFRWPTAFVRLSCRAVRYAAHYRKPAVLASLFTGYFAGVKAASQEPFCTPYVEVGREEVDRVFSGDSAH